MRAIADRHIMKEWLPFRGEPGIAQHGGVGGDGKVAGEVKQPQGQPGIAKTVSKVVDNGIGEGNGVYGGRQALFPRQQAPQAIGIALDAFEEAVQHRLRFRVSRRQAVGGLPEAGCEVGPVQANRFLRHPDAGAGRDIAAREPIECFVYGQERLSGRHEEV